MYYVPPKRHGSERLQEFETSESPFCSKILRNAPNLCGQLLGFLSLWADKGASEMRLHSLLSARFVIELKSKATWKRL